MIDEPPPPYTVVAGDTERTVTTPIPTIDDGQYESGHRPRRHAFANVSGSMSVRDTEAEAVRAPAGDVEEDSYSDPFATPPPSPPRRLRDIVQQDTALETRRRTTRGQLHHSSFEEPSSRRPEREAASPSPDSESPGRYRNNINSSSARTHTGTAIASERGPPIRRFPRHRSQNQLVDRAVPYGSRLEFPVTFLALNDINTSPSSRARGPRAASDPSSSSSSSHRPPPPRSPSPPPVPPKDWKRNYAPDLRFARSKMHLVNQYQEERDRELAKRLQVENDQKAAFAILQNESQEIQDELYARRLQAEEERNNANDNNLNANPNMNTNAIVNDARADIVRLILEPPQKKKHGYGRRPAGVQDCRAFR